jgi:hypothetical protein
MASVVKHGLRKAADHSLMQRKKRASGQIDERITAI